MECADKYDFNRDKVLLETVTNKPDDSPSSEPESTHSQQTESSKSRKDIVPLTPLAVPVPLKSTTSTPTLAAKGFHHLEEFESRGNVFDQMELMSIDEKAALEEILGLNASK